MTVRQIVKQWLLDHDYDGLWNADAECGCLVGDLEPGNVGECMTSECEAGYRSECNCGDGCDWHIGPKMEEEA